MLCIAYVSKTSLLVYSGDFGDEDHSRSKHKEQFVVLADMKCLLNILE